MVRLLNVAEAGRKAKPERSALKRGRLHHDRPPLSPWASGGVAVHSIGRKLAPSPEFVKWFADHTAKLNAEPWPEFDALAAKMLGVEQPPFVSPTDSGYRQQGTPGEPELSGWRVLR